MMLTNQNRYKPITRFVNIENRPFCVVDDSVAAERAQAYLHDAKKQIAEEGVNPRVTALSIQRALLIASDFGSSEAPLLMAERILQGLADDSYIAEEAILFYKLAAERGNPTAAYCMACCYAGRQDFPALLQAGEYYFASLSESEASLLADYYFQVSGHNSSPISSC